MTKSYVADHESSFAWRLGMGRGLVAGLVLGALLAVLATPALAVKARLWEHDEDKEFSAGKMEDVIFTADGRLRLGYAKSSLIQDAIDVVTAIAVHDGTIYVATGNQGKIYQVTPKGAKVLVDLPEPKVNCLAVDSAGRLYAGTSPKGVIYRMVKGKPPERFATLDELHVWSLVVAKDGSLIAGTGDEGRLWRVLPDGKAQRLHETMERHITVMVVGPDDAFYAGSEPKGLVYRFTLDKIDVFCDTPQGTVGALAFAASGDLYVGTADIGRSGERREQAAAKKALVQKATRGPATPSRSSQSSTRKIVVSKPSSPGVSGTARMPPGTNYLYRVDKKGNMMPASMVSSRSIFSLLETPEGVLIGTGPKGELFRLAEAGTADLDLIAKFEEHHIMALSGVGKGVLVGTGGAGKLYRTLEKLSAKGTYTSTVLDGVFPSKWGIIEVMGRVPTGTGLDVSTRCGNSEEVDTTWSDWQKAGEGIGGHEIKNRSARCIQYQLTFRGDDKSSVEVSRLALAYLQANIPPMIKAVNVASGSGNPGPKPPGAPKGPTRSAKPGVLKISWQAMDINQDRLQYRVYFREISESAWKVLIKRTSLTSFSWNTEGVPDAYYLIKVEVTDEPENPSGTAYTASRMSAPFLVDNTPPVVDVLEAKVAADGAIEATSKVSDGMSTLVEVYYSLDGERWVAVASEDGVFDERSESVRFRTEPVEPGEHTLMLKVRDRSDNVGSGRRVVVVPSAKK